jgi:protein-disulfide isomerase
MITRRLFVLTLAVAGAVAATPPPIAQAATPTTTSAATISAASLVRPSDPIEGSPNGTVTIIDFSDVRCPPCRAMNRRIQQLLKTDHTLRYVPVDFPILGPASILATKALFAAQIQGKYFALRARLMSDKRPPTLAILQNDAASLGLDWPRLQHDMDSKQTAQRIKTNLARGKAVGFHEIPAMYIGTIRVVGGLTSADLRAVVAQAATAHG